MIDYNDIDPNEIHTAIASWSGYVYQGKVAIYHSLRLIVEDHNAKDYALQLDSLDDFAIIESDTKIKSLHQVKALSSNYYNSYEKAFNDLTKRITKFPADFAFFHLAVQNEKSTIQIEKLHPSIKIYIYHDKNPYSTLSDIDSLINEVISKWLVIHERSFQNNQQYVELLRNCLENFILKQVIKIHSKNHKEDLAIREGAFNLTIPLSDFLNILNQDITDWIVSEEYFCHLMRLDLNKYYQEYITEIEETGPIDADTIVRLSKYLIHISSLDTIDLVLFIKTLLPHREAKFETITDYKNVAFQRTDLKDALFSIFKEITSEAEMNSHNLNWVSPSTERLIPTLIVATSASQSQTMRICNDIKKNILETDLEVAFENQQMITSELDVVSIFEELNHTMHHLPERTDINEEKRITNWKKVSLISIETAKGLLND